MEKALRKIRPAGRPAGFVVAALTVVSALMAGCAAQSSVVPIGQGDFTITKEASSGLFGTGSLKVDALQEASAHCSSFGKTIQVTNVVETKPPYVLSNYPRVDLQFRCVNRLFETEPVR